MFTPDMKEKVKQLIEEKNKKPDNLLFGYADAKNRPHALGQRIMNFFRKGKFKDLQSHNFRVSMGTKAYKDSGNIVAVKDYMGHAKLETTIRYIKIDTKESLNVLSRTITLN